MLARTSSATSSAVACGWVDTAFNTASRCAVTCIPCSLSNPAASSIMVTPYTILDSIQNWMQSR